jgi:putative DNA primase/helicase
LPELEKINWRSRNAFIVFDSDVVTKDSVKRALKELSTVLTLKGANVRVTTLPCDLDGTKNGADDFIVKYGKEALSHLLLISRNSHKNRKFIWNEEPIKSQVF